MAAIEGLPNFLELHPEASLLLCCHLPHLEWQMRRRLVHTSKLRRAQQLPMLVRVATLHPVAMPVRGSKPAIKP